MKKFLALFALMLLPALAFAQTLGPANHAYYGGFISTLEAPNGQTLYYIADRPQTDEDEPIVEMMDVNFDGKDDVVIMTASGATNAFYVFFVWNGEEYVMAQNDAMMYTDLPQFELYPEQGLVYAYGTSGFAGMLHDAYLFRWEGTNLRLLRHASSVIDEENDDMLRCTVTEISDGMEVVLWEGELNWQNPGTNGEADYLDAEDHALWEGLR